MRCECKNRIDAQLKERNIKLVGYAFVMPSYELLPTVATSWIDPDKAPRGQKKNAPAMFASHCPFCGIKFEETAVETYPA